MSCSCPPPQCLLHFQISCCPGPALPPQVLNALSAQKIARISWSFARLEVPHPALMEVRTLSLCITPLPPLQPIQYAVKHPIPQQAPF